MTLPDLQIGQQVWVELCSSVPAVAGKVYSGLVIAQQPSDYGGSVRVETEACQHVHARWKSMSFRWRDGRNPVSPWLVLRVPETDEEAETLKAQERQGKAVWPRELPLCQPEVDFKLLAAGEGREG